jgi:spore germination protein KC
VLAINPLSVKVDLKGEKPRISVRLKLEAEIFSIQSGVDYEQGQKQVELKKYLEQYCAEEVQRLIQKCQQEFKADIFGFGEVIHESNPKQWKDISKNWESTFQSLDINVNVDSRVRGTGLSSKSIK